jgi:hypothetical protein
VIEAPSTSPRLDVHLPGIDARVRAPQHVLDVVDQMFAHLSHVWTGEGTPVAIDVTFDDDTWQIGGTAASSRKTLSRNSSLTQVAGAAIASLLAEFGEARGLSVWRAAVVERGNHALVLVGDDWESAITLAAHLHARGWRVVSGDYAIIDLATMQALPFRKLLHVSSASVADFPLPYRGAIEASPWYSSTHAISFYAIDPTGVNGSAAWGTQSSVRAIVKVDGRSAQHASLEAGDNFSITETLSRSDIPANVDTAMLIMGGFIETADFLERWFSALPNR